MLTTPRRILRVPAFYDSDRPLVPAGWIDEFVLSEPPCGTSAFLLVLFSEQHRLFPRLRRHFVGAGAPRAFFCDICGRDAYADLNHLIFDCSQGHVVETRHRWMRAVVLALGAARPAVGVDRLLVAVGLAPLVGADPRELRGIQAALTRLFVAHWGEWEWHWRVIIDALPPQRVAAIDGALEPDTFAA